MPRELLHELTHEAEAPAQLAADVQLEGNLLQLVPHAYGVTAIGASGPDSCSLTVAQLQTATATTEARRLPGALTKLQLVSV